MADLKIIKQSLIEKAEKLSAEWNNTGFIVLNKDGTLDAIVFNHYQYEEVKRPYIATVDGVDGWVIREQYLDQYILPFDKYKKV